MRPDSMAISTGPCPPDPAFAKRDGENGHHKDRLVGDPDRPDTETCKASLPPSSGLATPRDEV